MTPTDRSVTAGDSELSPFKCPFLISKTSLVTAVTVFLGGSIYRGQKHNKDLVCRSYRAGMPGIAVTVTFFVIS